MSFVARGCSAVGSASPCQGEGRGFESRHPLEGAVASTPAVEWPSGEATACKAVHTGSIPVSTSNEVPARLAQRESASLTRKRSLVQSQYRALEFWQVRSIFRQTMHPPWKIRGECDNSRSAAGNRMTSPTFAQVADRLGVGVDGAQFADGLCRAVHQALRRRGDRTNRGRRARARRSSG
jgi:hypothetical protein